MTKLSSIRRFIGAGLLLALACPSWADMPDYEIHAQTVGNLNPWNARALLVDRKAGELWQCMSTYTGPAGSGAAYPRDTYCLKMGSMNLKTTQVSVHTMRLQNADEAFWMVDTVSGTVRYCAQSFDLVKNCSIAKKK